jgi:hypothetical protein
VPHSRPVNQPESPLSSAARREAKSRAALIAAYREGLGLTGIAVVRGPAGTRIVIVGDRQQVAPPHVGDADAARWWCRRAADGERVAAAATARLRRLESRDGSAGPSTVGSSPSSGDISAAVEQAAKRLHVILYSDEEIFADAQSIIARVEEEIETLRRAGQLKSINQSYRTYRMKATARGEKAAPYAD